MSLHKVPTNTIRYVYYTEYVTRCHNSDAALPLIVSSDYLYQSETAVTHYSSMSGNKLQS